VSGKGGGWEKQAPRERKEKGEKRETPGESETKTKPYLTIRRSCREKTCWEPPSDKRGVSRFFIHGESKTEEGGGSISGNDVSYLRKKEGPKGKSPP